MLGRADTQKTVLSTEDVRWGWYKKPELNQNVRRDQDKKDLFTKNHKRGLYKKPFQLNILGGAGTKNFFLLKMFDRTGIKSHSITYVRRSWHKKFFSTADLRRGWHKKSPLSQYFRRGWHKKRFFTKNIKRGLYKKAPLTQ